MSDFGEPQEWVYRIRDQIAHYRKAIVPVIAGVVGVVAAIYGADAEITVAVTALAASLGVSVVPNVEKQSHPSFQERKPKG